MRAVPVLALALLLLPIGFAAPASWTVEASNFAWTPAELTVSPGDVVTFRNAGGVHSFVSDSGLGACSLPCTIAFDAPGEHAYHCGVHPDMTGLVIVAAPGPDVRVASVAVRESQLGEWDVRYAVRNEGNVATTPFAIRVETLVDGEWRLLDERRAELPAGETLNGAASWDWDGARRVGRFEVRVVADALDEVAETDEGDNERRATIQQLLPIQGVVLPVP